MHKARLAYLTPLIFYPIFVPLNPLLVDLSSESDYLLKSAIIFFEMRMALES